MFLRIQKLFEPQKGWAFETAIQFKRQREIQALWIGIIAFCMPALLFYANRTAPCFRDTISHVYYTPIWGDVFVALTAFVGLFLLFYRGQSRAERWLAILAGVSAVVVAIVPTTGSGCEITYAPSRIFLFEDADTTLSRAFTPGENFDLFHGIAAGVLFFILTIFSMFVFTATDKTNPYQLQVDNRNKIIRNLVYRVSAVIMFIVLVLLSMNKVFSFTDCDIFNTELGIGQNELTCKEGKPFNWPDWDKYNLTFYFEWAALAAFGIAWFVKGRGGGFLLLDETPNQIISKPWWMNKGDVNTRK
ncbi:MAG: hypothetical protein AAF217_05440 [Pseudomonadota bacterium]